MIRTDERRRRPRRWRLGTGLCLVLATTPAACGSSNPPAAVTASPVATTPAASALPETASPVAVAVAYLKALGSGGAVAACAAARLPAGCRIGGPFDTDTQATARACAALTPAKGTRDMAVDAGRTGCKRRNPMP